MSEHSHAYAGYCVCGSLVAATVDTPERNKENARQMGDWVRRGYRVERVTVEHVRQHLAFCKCGKSRRRPRSQQAEMAL